MRSPLQLAGAWIIACLAAVAMPVMAAGETRNVLVLYSSTRLLPANVEGDRGLRAALQSATDRRVELYAEFLDVPRFNGESYARTVTAFLREKYAALPPDVIVVGGDEALEFVLNNRVLLFPDTPVVLMGVAASFLRLLPPLPADVVGAPVDYDSVGTIDLAMRLHPDATHLVLVTGSSESDRRWEARLRGEVSRFPARAKPEFLSRLPTEALRRRLAELGGDAVVFTPGYFADGDGRVFTPRESARIVAAAAAAPVYGPYNTFIGTGVVGGRMPSFEAIGMSAGNTVNDLLSGMAPASLPAPKATPMTLQVDWRQARRWGVRESDVPAEAVLEFKEPTFWEAHRNEVIVATSVILIQAALIAALLLERRLRRRTAAALHESEARMNLAARAAGLSTWVWNVAQGRIAATGRSRKRDHPPLERSINVDGLLASVHPSDREAVERAMRNASQKRQDVDIEYRTIRPDGEVRWIGARGRADNGNAQRLIGVALDVTDRKNAELQAVRDRAALRQMTRVSMLGQLSASIAHQLNQPLAAIRNNAEAARKMLDREQVDLAELREICDDIVTEDQRAADVIARLRQLFRRGELQLLPLDVNEVVLETLGLLAAELAMRRVTSIVDLAPTLPGVRGDRVQLQQVLLNLIVNASDAMADDPEPDRRLTLRTEAVGESVRVCVVDQGHGIPVDDLKSVLEPFWSSKDDGMGIGLAICQAIVVAHGGTLTAANNPDRGATFCFTLPVKVAS